MKLWHATRKHFIALSRLLCILVLVALACDLPRDPQKTLERVRGRVLTVGVSEDAPFIVRRGEEAIGPEPDLVRGFAASLGATVKWNWAAQDRQMAALRENHLDLVAGLTSATPWKKSVALTRPFSLNREKRAFAVPAGENAFLSALERYLAGRGEEK